MSAKRKDTAPKMEEEGGSQGWSWHGLGAPTGQVFSPLQASVCPSAKDGVCPL